MSNNYTKLESIHSALQELQQEFNIPDDDEHLETALILIEDIREEYLISADRVKARKQGYSDGLLFGENKNPYKNNGMCDEWWLYEKGYEEGVAEYCRGLESGVE